LSLSAAGQALDAASHVAHRAFLRMRAGLLAAGLALAAGILPAAASPMMLSAGPEKDDQAVAPTGRPVSTVDRVLQLLGFGRGDDVQLDPETLRAAMLNDPSQEGLRAVARSLRESDELRNVLGTTIGLRDTGLAGNARDTERPVLDIADADAAVDPRSAGREPALQAARETQEAGADPEIGDERNPQRRRRQPEAGQVLDPNLIEDEGPTLRTVLRSFIRVRRPETRRHSRTVSEALSDGEADVEDTGLNLGERLLDSRMLGEALRSVVTPTAFYDVDNSFAVFGEGRFALELDLSSDLGSVTLSERASGASLSVPIDREGPSKATQERRQEVEIIQTLYEFLRSATGVSLMIISGVMLVMFALLRFAVSLRR